MMQTVARKPFGCRPNEPQHHPGFVVTPPGRNICQRCDLLQCRRCAILLSSSQPLGNQPQRADGLDNDIPGYGAKWRLPTICIVVLESFVTANHGFGRGGCRGLCRLKQPRRAISTRKKSILTPESRAMIENAIQIAREKGAYHATRSR
jgi:hypothetical protein